MLQLTGITKMIVENKLKISILNELDLHVSAGEFVSIMGSSGAGKSTLLNVLGLLDEPTSGVYEFHGKNVRNLGSGRLSEFRNKHIGFVFQSFMLIPRLTVRENIEVPLLYTSLSRKQRKQRIDAALERVGLSQKAREATVNLSGGQKQKVAIARAIINDPDLLLADEPTGNLDAKSKDEILQIFQDLNAEGKTIVLVTHDPDIANLASQRLLMKDGQLIERNSSQQAGTHIQEQFSIEVDAKGQVNASVSEQVEVGIV